MALIHPAELHPTKLELVAGWLPRRRWYNGPAATLSTPPRWPARSSPASAKPRSSWSDEVTTIITEPVILSIVRSLELGMRPPSAAIAALTGTWRGQPNPVVLALANRR
jgi:hypothetical protein